MKGNLPVRSILDKTTNDEREKFMLMLIGTIILMDFGNVTSSHF